MSWTLNTLPLSSWPQLTAATLHLVSRGADTLTLTLERPIDAADPAGLAPGDTVVLAYSGTTRFRGRVTASQASASDSAETWEITASGLWWWLEHIVYQREFRLDPLDPWFLRSGMRLFANRDNQLVPLHVQIADAVDWAVTCGAPIALGSNPTGPQPPQTDALNLTCAEIINRCIQWVPDVCSRVDYAPATPTLHFIPWSVASTTPVSLAITSPALSQLTIAPRPDMLVPGVRLILENASNQVGWQPIVQTSPPSYSGLEAQAVHLVLDLRGEISSTQLAGLAERYHAAFADLQHAGSLTLDEDAPSLQPGQALRLTGGRAAWTTMRAQVQQVTHDLLRSSTTVQFGPPAHLGIQDLVEVIRNAQPQRVGAAFYLSTGERRAEVQETNRLAQLEAKINGAAIVGEAVCDPENPGQINLNVDLVWGDTP